MIKTSLNDYGTNKVFFWKLFRLLFVIFSLYLMGDAFYRWDGFSYYAPFSEFLPSVALVSILWSVVAVFTSMTIWISIRLVEWFSRLSGRDIKSEHLLIFLFTLGFSAVISYKIKRHFLLTQHFPLLNITVLICVLTLAIMATWYLRNKAQLLLDTVQERITPLFWLFSIFVILSVPLVAYKMWFIKADSRMTEEIISSAIADKDRPNIILVTFDSLTARNMSLYDYNRPTTPNIDEWAKSASVFTKTEAESNYTMPTLTSLMTGKRLWTHGLYHSEAFNPSGNNINNLASELKKNGYFNIVYMGNRVAMPKNLGVEKGFDTILKLDRTNIKSFYLLDILDKFISKVFGSSIRLYNWIIKEDFVLYELLLYVSRHVPQVFESLENVFDTVITTIDHSNRKPYFVWMHFFPPHDPYLPPKPYQGMFNPSSDLRSPKSQLLARNLILKRGLNVPDISPERKQSLINLSRDRYDESIRWCDEQFSYLIEKLKKINMLENSVIILSSDHGESFEHGYFQHGKEHLYEQVTHIPLIIMEPGQTNGLVIDDIVEQIDIPATILELVNIQVPTWMEGRSMVPLMRSGELPGRPAISMRLEGNRSGEPISTGTIAVWDGHYKLIHYLEENRSLLFDLNNDAGEIHNLFDEKPETGQYLLGIVKYNIELANENITAGK